MNIFFKQFAKFHAFVLRKSTGTMMNTLSGTNIFLLNTIGSKSGKERHAALVYLREGDAYVVVASAGGQDTHPAWYKNMLAHPDKISITVNGREKTVRFDKLSEDEKPAMWGRFISTFKQFEEYKNKTNRNIPIIRLTPIS